MVIQIDGVEPSKAILDRVAQEKQPVILNFSRGKDSLAVWIECERRDITVIPVHKSLVPGLNFVREDLARYEDIFGVHIIDLPSDSFWRMLKYNVWQPPDRVPMLAACNIPRITDAMWDKMVRLSFAQEDTWMLDGVRAADGPTRRMSIMVHGPVKQHSRRISGVWDWQVSDVRKAIKDRGLTLGPDYEWFAPKRGGRSFDGLTYEYIKPIMDNAPDDWELIQEWFPLIELEIMRAEEVIPEWEKATTTP